MPTYEYACEACGHKFEEFQSIKAKPITRLPQVKKTQSETPHLRRCRLYLQRQRLLHHRLPLRQLQRMPPKPTSPKPKPPPPPKSDTTPATDSTSTPAATPAPNPNPPPPPPPNQNPNPPPPKNPSNRCSPLSNPKFLRCSMPDLWTTAQTNRQRRHRFPLPHLPHPPPQQIRPHLPLLLRPLPPFGPQQLDGRQLHRLPPHRSQRRTRRPSPPPGPPEMQAPAG